MEPAPLGPAQRLAGQVDVPLGAARQRGDDRPPHLGGDLAHAAVVALRRGREAGFDDVHAERVELAGEAELLLGGEAVAGGLLAVAQRGVEDQDVAGCPYVAFGSVEGERRKAPRTFGSAAPVHSSRDAATVSCCSSRHAADPWLTNKDGKQEAKEDDDERQTEQHVGRASFDSGVRDATAFVRLRASGGLSRGYGVRERTCQGRGRLTTQVRSWMTARRDAPVDEYTAMHNNTTMNTRVARPGHPVSILVRSTGATG